MILCSHCQHRVLKINRNTVNASNNSLGRACCDVVAVVSGCEFLSILFVTDSCNFLIGNRVGLKSIRRKNGQLDYIPVRFTYVLTRAGAGVGVC